MLYCILIFLNCMGSWGVLPTCVQVKIWIPLDFLIYMILYVCICIYIYTRGSLSLICSHTCHFLQSSSASFSDCEFYMIPPHDNLPLPITKNNNRIWPNSPRSCIEHAGRRTQNLEDLGLSRLQPMVPGMASPLLNVPGLGGRLARESSVLFEGSSMVFLISGYFRDLKSGIYWHCQIPAAILLVSSASDMECHQVNTLGE